MKRFINGFLYIIGIIAMVLFTITLIGIVIFIWVVVPLCLEDIGIERGPLWLEDIYKFFN